MKNEGIYTVDDSGWHKYFETHDADEETFSAFKDLYIRNCAYKLMEFVTKNPDKTLDCVCIVIKQQQPKSIFHSTVGIKWHVGNDEH